MKTYARITNFNDAIEVERFLLLAGICFTVYLDKNEDMNFVFGD